MFSIFIFPFNIQMVLKQRNTNTETHTEIDQHSQVYSAYRLIQPGLQIHARAHQETDGFHDSFFLHLPQGVSHLPPYTLPVKCIWYIPFLTVPTANLPPPSAADVMVSLAPVTIHCLSHTSGSHHNCSSYRTTLIGPPFVY